MGLLATEAGRLKGTVRTAGLVKGRTTTSISWVRWSLSRAPDRHVPQRSPSSTLVGWVWPLGHSPPPGACVHTAGTSFRNTHRGPSSGQNRHWHQAAAPRLPISADSPDPGGHAQESLPVKCPEHANPHRPRCRGTLRGAGVTAKGRGTRGCPQARQAHYRPPSNSHSCSYCESSTSEVRRRQRVWKYPSPVKDRITLKPR